MEFGKFISRNVTNRSVEVINCLSIQFWCPYNRNDRTPERTDSLESVQTKITKMIPGLKLYRTEEDSRN